MYSKRVLIQLFFILAFFLLVNSAEASTLYLSPGKTNIGQGAVTSVQVRLNTQGEAVNAVSAYLTYPADKLEVAWVRYGGSFSIAAEGSYGGGGIRISRGSINPVSGNVTVATIGFKGKVLGTAGVVFIGGSAAPRASDSSDSLTGNSGGTYTIVPYVPKPTGEASGDTIPSKISDLVISEVSTNSALATWKTDEKTDSNVEYGLEKDQYILNTVNTALATEHSLRLEGPFFVPGLIIHLRVKAKDEGGNVTTSEDQVIHLKGYQVKISLVNERNLPLSDAQVVLYSEPQKGVTDKNGEAVFSDMTAGRHLLVIKWQGLERVKEINIPTSLSFETYLSLRVDTSPVTTEGKILGLDPLYVTAGATFLTFIFLVFILFIRLFKIKNRH